VAHLKRALPIFLATVLLSSPLNTTASATDGKPTLALTTPGSFGLGVCASDTDTNCIVSVSSFNKNGVALAGKHLTDVTFDPIQDKENTRLDATSTWEIPGEASPQDVQLKVDLDTPAKIITTNQTGAALRVFVVNSDEISSKIKIVIRTDWLKPQNVQLVAENAEFFDKKVSTSREWTFIGSRTNVSNYFNWIEAAKNNFMDKADQDTAALHFIIHHVGSTDNSSFFPIACADKGYTVQSWNSSSAGTPYWDSSSKSLNFGIQAPHIKANGEQNKGFFSLWAPEEFIACRWPENTLVGAPGITVQVLNPDGTPQVAVTSVSRANKILYFFASGFHYSSPIIRIGASTKALAKRTSIICVKGKSSKKVSAINPQCPKGWEKKRG
jgi:hypothetical protein